MREISIKGIIVGFITTFSASLVLLVMMPLIFMDLVKTGKLDVLIVSFWPQIYTLAVILISGVFGIYIGSVVASRVKWVNSILIALLSLGLTYIINQPASEFSSTYPLWFTGSSYILWFLSIFIGHFSAVKLITKSSSKDAANGAA